jgi:hypothetical protein
MRHRDRDHTIAAVRRRHGPKAAEAVQAFRTATGPLRDHYRARVADYVGELGLELMDAVSAGLTIGEAWRLVDGSCSNGSSSQRDVDGLGHWFRLTCRVLIFVIEHTVIVRTKPSADMREPAE